MVNEDIVNFKVGKVVSGKWKVLKKVGAGGCGAVYMVHDVKNPSFKAALKAEKNDLEDGGVLKLEVEVFRKLLDRKHCIRMIQSGKRCAYSFIVMTLCDRDMMSIKKNLDENKFSEGTILRIGVHGLYAIKQVHEVGYVHRDVKPGNMVVGISGRDRKTVFLIDFGMVRSYVREENGKMVIRKPRQKVLLRGTLRYCSLNVHARMEQGRVDDLWSLVFMLVELYKGLPWNRDTDEKEIKKKKESLSDEMVFKDCPAEFIEMAKYLRTLGYFDRPDYFKFYEMFTSGMKRCKSRFSDPYEWEKLPIDEEKLKTEDTNMTTCIETSEREKKNKKPLPDEEMEPRLYPTTDPAAFKEVVLKL